MFDPVTVLLYDSRNSNIKIVHNSIEHFFWNLSDFSSDVAFENLFCLWTIFINAVFQVPPQKIVRGWDLGNRVGSGYQFEAKWVCPLGSIAWGIQEFCSSNEVVPHLAGTPQCSYQCLSSFSMQKQCSAVIITWFPSLSSKKYGLKSPLLPITHHIVSFSWHNGRWVCLWGC